MYRLRIRRRTAAHHAARLKALAATAAYPCMLERLVAHGGEEPCVSGVRARPPALDVVDPKLVEPPGDRDLVADRKRDAHALAAVAQGGVVDLDVGRDRLPSAGVSTRREYTGVRADATERSGAGMGVCPSPLPSAAGRLVALRRPVGQLDPHGVGLARARERQGDAVAGRLASIAARRSSAVGSRWPSTAVMTSPPVGYAAPATVRGRWRAWSPASAAGVPSRTSVDLDARGDVRVIAAEPGIVWSPTPR